MKDKWSDPRFYRYIPSGDIAQCAVALPFAMQKLSEMVKSGSPKGTEFIAGNGVKVHVSTYPNVIRLTAGGGGIIWLPRSNAFANNYTIGMTPNGLSWMPSDITNFPSSTSKEYKYQMSTTFFAFNSFESSPMAWTNGKDAVIIDWIALKNNAQATHYGCNHALILTSPQQVQRLFLNDLGTALVAYTPNVSVNAQAAFIRDKIYILNTTRFVSGNQGLNSSGHCASMVGGNLYIANSSLQSTSGVVEYSLDVHTLIDIPVGSADIYGTTSISTTWLNNLAGWFPLCGSAFSDTDATHLFKVVSNTSEIGLVTTIFGVIKYDLSNLGDVPELIYQSSATVNNQYRNIVQFNIFDGKVSFCFRTNGGTLVLVKIEWDSLFEDWVSTETNYPTTGYQRELFVSAVDDIVVTINTLTSPTRTEIKVLKGGIVTYSFQSTAQIGFFNTADYTDFFNSVYLSREYAGSFVRMGGYILLSTMRFTSSLPSGATWAWPDLIRIKISDGSVTPVPKVLTGGTTQVFRVF